MARARGILHDQRAFLRFSLACVAQLAEGGDSSFLLSFAVDPVVYVIGASAYTDRWAHYVTRGGGVSQTTDSQRIFEFIRPRYGNNPNACGLNTRQFRRLARRVPAEFAHASRARWRWGVKKDTPRGSLGERPDDQAIQVILVFRRAAPEEYTALSFAWTKRAVKETDLYTSRLPQESFPRCQVAVRPAAQRSSPAAGGKRRHRPGIPEGCGSPRGRFHAPQESGSGTVRRRPVRQFQRPTASHRRRRHVHRGGHPEPGAAEIGQPIIAIRHSSFVIRHLVTPPPPPSIQANHTRPWWRTTC